MDVDLLLLSRDLSPPRRDVWQGIESQVGVRVHVHRVTGAPRPGDRNRFETICRARNDARRIGLAPLALCLDDDVVLASDCIASLVEGLRARPGFAALAADSAGEMAGGWENWDYPAHVGMAATLFRRERLAALTFRFEAGKCECRCCCEDLRRAGYGIGYLPSARAWHRPSGRESRSDAVKLEPAREARSRAFPYCGADVPPAFLSRASETPAQQSRSHKTDLARVWRKVPPEMRHAGRAEFSPPLIGAITAGFASSFSRPSAPKEIRSW